MSRRKRHLAPVVVPLGAPPPQGDFVLAVPGTLAPCYGFDLPQRVTGAPRLRIAAQQLADRIGPGAEDLKLIPVGDGAWTHAIVLAKDWRAEAGEDPCCLAVLPDYLTLPAAPGLAVVQLRVGHVVARLGPDDGFAAPVSVAPILLKAALAGKGLHEAWLGDGVPDMCLTVVRDAGLVMIDEDGAGAQTFAAGELGSDLRLGPETDKGTLTPQMRLWGLAAGIAALAFLVWAASEVTETRAIRAEAAALRARTIAVLRRELIPEGPILDIRAQVARRMGGPAGKETAADPLEEMSRATAILFDAGPEVARLRFTPLDGFTFDIAADSFAEVDALVDALTAEGIAARAETVRARPDGTVAAQLRLIPGPRR